MKTAIPQSLIEFDHRFPEIRLERMLSAIRRLQSAGYAVFDVSPNAEEFSFCLHERK
jgi:hypothetical protein